VGTGRAANGAEISGYHMHMGVTQGGDRRRPFATVAGAPEGAISPDKKVMGTYLHGLFAANAFRGAFLSGLGTKADPNQKYESGIDEVLDRLAAHLEQHLDLDALLALARSPTRT
jgi:adenosylcobyric acid synthase